MTSSGEVVVVRRTQMVGPPYLYRGAQVCGRRASRTCIFLLISFGAASSMIGLVLFTADLDLRSGMWAAGVVLMAVGVVLLTWFLTLCCAARAEYNSLPAAHPARVKSPRPVMHPVATSTPAYQLLPLTHTRGRPPGHTSTLTAGQTDGYTDENESYIENTGSLMRGQTGSMMRRQTGSYVERSGSYLGQTGNYMEDPIGSYMGNQTGSYMRGQTGKYMGGPTGSYMRGQTGNYMGSPTGNTMGSQTGTPLEKQTDYMGRQRASYSAGQDNRYNEALRHSPRGLQGYEAQPPPGFTLERTPGFPALHTWDHRLGRAQVYPTDGPTWGSLARSSPRPHLQEYPGSYARTHRQEGIHATLSPGSRHSVGYSPGHMGTHRQSRPEDQPPAYCDLIPH